MRPLKLDYQAARFAHPVSILMLATAIILTLVSGWQYQRMNQEIHSWESKIAEMERATQRTSLQSNRKADKGENLQEINYANSVIRQIALPWDNLFTALESVRNDKVAVLSIEPNAQKGLVKISGESKTPEEMLDYIRSLQTQGTLTNVFLASHQIQERDPEKPVRFALTAGWATPR